MTIVEKEGIWGNGPGQNPCSGCQQSGRWRCSLGGVLGSSNCAAQNGFQRVIDKKNIRIWSAWKHHLVPGFVCNMLSVCFCFCLCLCLCACCFACSLDLHMYEGGCAEVHSMQKGHLRDPHQVGWHCREFDPGQMLVKYHIFDFLIEAWLGALPTSFFSGTIDQLHVAGGSRIFGEGNPCHKEGCICTWIGT